jgi:peptidoglycan/xylan/chitin deacetylase (PgdA/CDA1 family)
VGLAEPFPEGPEPLLLTFDDGGASAYDPVADLLEERGWRGHFFVATDFVDRPGFLTRPQVRELRRRGHLVGSHSSSHPRVMRACGAEQLRREWRQSAALLAELLGEPVRAASVPGGYYSAAVAEAAAEAGIRVLFHSAPRSRGRREGGCLVLGRYAVMAGMTAARCAALARGRPLAALRAWLLWNAKQAAKAASVGAYLRVRDFLVNR